MHVFFLEAAVGLTKRFAVSNDGTLVKSPYPHVQNFTSHLADVADLEQFGTKIIEHGDRGHCLLKGLLSRELHNESRAGATEPLGSTQWACWDLDRADYPDVSSLLDDLGVSHADWIEQYSASTGIHAPNTPASDRLSAHVFQMFVRPYPASSLKAWLLWKNLTTPRLRAGIRLSRTGAALVYPLDITTCQNDKLIYIAKPVLGPGVLCSFTEDRVRLLNSEHRQLDLSQQLNATPPPEVLRKEVRELTGELRKKAGLDALRAKPRVMHGLEIQPSPGEAQITSMKTERGFVYFNLNGGDSWGYYHPEGNYEFIYNFKGEPVYLTKELLPSYYVECRRSANAANATPSKDGDLLLAFRDIRSASYWNGTWNPRAFELNLYQARTEKQLEDFMLSHGRALGDFVPIWSLEFDPHSNVVIDEERRVCNTYVMSAPMRDSIERLRHASTPRSEGATIESFPIIHRILTHAIGVGPTLDHFLNWLAVIYQKRIKLGTAWLLHGVPGTGKGLTVNSIIAPTLGARYVALRRAQELESSFNGWLEHTLLAFVDEMQPARAGRGAYVDSDLKNLITEPVVSIRHMYRNPFNAPSYTNWIFSSNRSEPWPIEPEDRRFNVGDYGAAKLEITGVELQVHLPKELPGFLDYILSLKASESRARQVLKSEARTNMILTSRTSADMVADALKGGDLEFLWASIPDEDALAVLGGISVQAVFGSAYVALLKTVLAEGAKALDRGEKSWISRFSRDEMYIIFEHTVGSMPKTPNKFTQFLRHRGIETQRIRKGDKLHYGMEVTWRMEEEWLRERLAELGPAKAKHLSVVPTSSEGSSRSTSAESSATTSSTGAKRGQLP